jgi:hypothetical protein
MPFYPYTLYKNILSYAAMLPGLKIMKENRRPKDHKNKYAEYTAYSTQ